MKRKKHPLHELADRQIDYVEALLFKGSPYGGSSLSALLSQYKETGPFHPIRGELLQHLNRCITELAAMDAYIIARARGMPFSRVHQHLVRREKRKSKSA